MTFYSTALRPRCNAFYRARCVLYCATRATVTPRKCKTFKPVFLPRGHISEEICAPLNDRSFDPSLPRAFFPSLSLSLSLRLLTHRPKAISFKLPRFLRDKFDPGDKWERLSKCNPLVVKGRPNKGG